MQVAPYDEEAKATLPTVAAADDHATGLATNLNHGTVRERNASLTVASPSRATAATHVTARDDGARVKPKQKRNKPTLSCLLCVSHKTKCDRGRPCLACVKRQSRCEYTAVANLIASADRKDGGSKARYVMKPPSKIGKTSHITSPSGSHTSPTATDNGWPNTEGRSQLSPMSPASQTESPYLYSTLPYSQSSPSNVFGVGSQHPFSNYWTCQGGLPEVITVLPSKPQADILVAKYFEVVDPVYPFLHRRTFYSDYELFWALSMEEKGKTDASLIALHYAIYALGTQFMQFTPYEERSQTAEFYCSAANQALRVYSYLNKTSMRAIQAMLLMAYFLMNDNHASDAYAWAGIHLRQTYALRLHRDPEIVVPQASTLEKQQRRKLWQAVFFQDTFLTILLKLPPTATHSDVPVESLADENELSNDGLDSDVAYMRSMWHLGNLVQENLASPLSLSLPIANSPRQKESLVAAFRRLYKSFPAQLTILDYNVLQQQAQNNSRAVRQNLFLTSNYFHCLALLQMAENKEQGVEANVKAALEAAHEALCAFFKLWGLFEVEAGVWWVFQHRAFEEALLIVKSLAIPPPPESPYDAAIYAKGKEDIGRMLEIMERYGGNLEMHTTRKEVLREAFERIVV
ncbi:uncharacterized protein MYCFIDRAFT_131283 [Pseudocercospora fijiensis CIRAD86]|uniref:Zn(2)-C6 fungal-type domain-containing protein n=1 Tax=Pseudocercospora fijiensis (strain CIRAD86) TaxID=383855 RepID=M3A5J8_PSEFD|nr:uncharacterized protein MYCFIDRAFT_131283 [Pseudocercospora fijiensis CIRAD86]EME86404.1 hypothetical protein MYCFIDRAFT_131283 [Pseudocercospora fijiensis CIRAD86]